MTLFRKKHKAESDAPEVIPAHIGIIMDGNGRWAKKRGLPRTAGHVTGAKTFRTIAKYCDKRGIRFLTVYAFSTENWRRPKEEVDAIMDLLRDYLKESLSDFQSENIRTRFLGDRTKLAPDIVAMMEEAERVTADKTGMTLNIALNYGGRDEIVRAVNRWRAENPDGELDEKTLSHFLDTGDQPDPDLILRPSGEYRTSNFLLWQSAYAEYVFMDDILWPDFSPEDLERALAEFARRSRRFGGT